LPKKKLVKSGEKDDEKLRQEAEKKWQELFEIVLKDFESYVILKRLILNTASIVDCNK
jgi:hypothetical protein